MAADLVTRLLLETKAFDDNIKKSAGQIAAFENNVKTIGSSVLKFAGGLGIAMTAGEALNKSIQSTQTTIDAWEINMGAAKDSVDVFFRSLVSGDWTPFQEGIVGTFKKLKEFQSLLDELDDKKLSLGYIKADDLRDLARFEEIGKDSTKSYNERIDAVQNYEGVVNHLNKKLKETNELELKALTKGYSAKSGLNINREDLDYFVKHTNYSGELTSEAVDRYKEYIRLKKESADLEAASTYDSKTYGYDPSRKAQKEYADRARIADLYFKEYEFQIKQGHLAEEGNEGRKKTVETLTNIRNQEEEIYRIQIKADKLRKNVTKSGDSADLKSESALKTKTKAAVDLQDLDQKNIDGIRKELQEKLGKIGDAPLELAMPIKYVESEEQSDIKGSIADKEAELQALYVAYNEATNADLRKIYAERIKDLENSIDEMHSTAKNGMVDIAEAINSLIENSIVSSFQSLGDAIGSGDFGKGMKDGLISLMGILEQFGAALIATGVASFALKSVLVNPVAAIIAGGALIVTAGVAKALLSSAQDFADGGIVYGETFARVGEYAGANTNPEVIAPLNKLKDILGDRSGGGELRLAGEFKIRGKDLVYIIDKQTRYNSRT